MACKVATVKDLRLFLDEMEKNWTEEDDVMIGRFDSQPVRVPYGKWDFEGLGPAYIEFEITGLGFIIDQPDYEGADEYST